MMVFCRDCNKKVADCPHCVPALKVKRVEVFDPKVKTLAYDEPRKILEIAFKNGQSWQLKPIPAVIYQELLQQTLSSFLKFIAHRYQANPVKPGNEDRIPNELCPACHQGMTNNHQTMGKPVRVLWHCEACNQSLWKTYSNESVRERRKGLR
jgi:hypothetical protein